MSTTVIPAYINITQNQHGMAIHWGHTIAGSILQKKNRISACGMDKAKIIFIEFVNYSNVSIVEFLAHDMEDVNGHFVILFSALFGHQELEQPHMLPSLNGSIAHDSC